MFYCQICSMMKLYRHDEGRRNCTTTSMHESISSYVAVADLVWFDVVRSNPPFFPWTHAHKNYSIKSSSKFGSVLGSVLVRFNSVTSFFRRSSTVDSVILIQGQDDSEKARIFFPEVFFNSHVSGFINLWWVPQNQQDS